MKDFVYINSLYDEYSELLTEKQKNYFQNYFFEDLSISEISENEEISRAGAHKAIKEVIQKLENYEDKLKFVDKKKKVLNIIKDTEYEGIIKEIL